MEDSEKINLKTLNLKKLDFNDILNQDIIFSDEVLQSRKLRKIVYSHCVKKRVLRTEDLIKAILSHPKTTNFIRSINLNLNCIHARGIANFFIKNKLFDFLIAFMMNNFIRRIIHLNFSLDFIEEFSENYSDFFVKNMYNILRTLPWDSFDILTFLLKKYEHIGYRKLLGNDNTLYLHDNALASLYLENFTDFLQDAPNYSIMRDEKFFYNFYVHGLGSKFTLKYFSGEFVFSNLPYFTDMEERAKAGQLKAVALSYNLEFTKEEICELFIKNSEELYDIYSYFAVLFFIRFPLEDQNWIRGRFVEIMRPRQRQYDMYLILLNRMMIEVTYMRYENYVPLDLAKKFPYYVPGSHPLDV